MRPIDGNFGTGDRSGPAEKAQPRLDRTLLVNAQPSVVVQASHPLDESYSCYQRHQVEHQGRHVAVDQGQRKQQHHAANEHPADPRK